ncbi:MAG: radical SAM protein [Lentisphaerota bacterium]
MNVNKLTNNKVKIALVEIGDSFGEQYYFPYSIGILRAYAEKFISSDISYEFLPIIYKLGDIDKSAAKVLTADIVFYSTYLWNFKASLDLAVKVKKCNSEIINVFGGPQIPESKERISALLQKYPFVDIVSFGDGEIPFLRIIERYFDRKWNLIPSIGYHRIDSTIAYNEFKEKIEDINDIPSPYLSGVFDELIKQNPQERWQARIETNRGCPFTCAFCYWGKKAEHHIKQFELNRIYSEIDWLSKNKVEFVFCCDANFGILRRDFDIAKKVVANKTAFGYPKVFSVQNTKNSQSRIFSLQKILNDAGLQKGVNLALQSLNPDTLKHIERNNIDNATYTELQKLFTKNNIPTFTDLIIGLPGETYDSFTRGVSEIIANGQHNRIQFINLTILENTLMATPEYQDKYGLKIVEVELIPHHSSRNNLAVPVETQQLVVATLSMIEKDWIKTRVFSWMVSLLYFNKLVQIPFIILHETCAIPYKDLFEIFISINDRLPMLARILSCFIEKAENISAGGSEYSYSRKWLNISWYPDELMFITICAEDNLEQFYSEVSDCLLLWTKEHAYAIDPAIISESIRLNYSIIKQPSFSENVLFESNYNIWEVYQGILKGEAITMQKGTFEYLIDKTTQKCASWENWCREVVWYGNKRGDYIYSASKIVKDDMEIQ